MVKDNGELKSAMERELSTLGARDALVLAGICVPPEQPRASGHKLRHAFLLRLVGARRSMRRLEKRGHLKPGWSVNYEGAHCQVTELGTRTARAVAVIVNLGPGEGKVSNAGVVLRLLLNRRVQM